MAIPPDENQGFNPHPDFPGDPEFYRRVLHYMPTPLCVVDESGATMYANHSMMQLGGWDPSISSLNVLDHVHPDDQGLLAAAFSQIVPLPQARVLGTSRPWSEIYFRLVRSDGSALPVALVGSGGLMDEVVQGIIFEVRPDVARHLMTRVLDSLSQGASMHHLLTNVARIVAMPPLDLDAVIMLSTNGETFSLAASTSTPLADAMRDVGEAPWLGDFREPAAVSLDLLPEIEANRLRATGVQNMWAISVDSPLTETTLRLVATSKIDHTPDNGPKDRLRRVREVASVVLLRSETDMLVARAAAHDPLTELPNRAAFYQQVMELDSATDRAAIHFDLDGLNNVNIIYGQPAGDAVLQVIADRLRSTCGPGPVLGRLGDDEFAVLVVHDTTHDVLSETLDLAGRILDAVNDPIVVAGQSVTVSTSIGVAVAASGISTDHLLTWADAALHDAKRGGGGQIRHHEGESG